MNWKLFHALWCAGLPGVLALVWAITQSVPAAQPLPAPLWVIGLVSALQNTLLLVLATFAGVRLAPRIGLAAPILSAWLSAQPVAGLIRLRFTPAVIGGVFGVVILWGHSVLLPLGFGAAETANAMPLAVRVLYGGVTEEILVRWGLMTVLAWLFWRVFAGEAGRLSPAAAWAAIVISAILFGIGHLPAAGALLGGLTTPLIVYIIAANAGFGLIAGYLYWRHGLDAAIFAHVFAHLGFALVSGLQ